MFATRRFHCALAFTDASGCTYQIYIHTCVCLFVITSE